MTNQQKLQKTARSSRKRKHRDSACPPSSSACPPVPVSGPAAGGGGVGVPAGDRAPGPLYALPIEDRDTDTDSKEDQEDSEVAPDIDLEDANADGVLDAWGRTSSY